MAASQPALFNVQEFTDNGITLVGGRLYTYAFGTTALKVAYTDPEGTVPQTYTADGLGGQYIALNARGELPSPLYMASSGAYDISLRRADGSTVWTRRAEGVGNFDFLLESSSGSNQIGNGGESVAQSFNALQLADYAAVRAYLGPRKSVYVTGYLATTAPVGIAGMFVPDPSDTVSADNGATILIASNGMRWKRQYSGGVDIRWWGARFDGTTDDTAAVQACINFAIPKQLIINLPAGTARITAVINVPFANLGLNMVGQGYQLTRFNYAALANGQSLFLCIGYPGAVNGATVRGIGFDGNSGTNAFGLVGAGGQLIERCQFGANAFACLMANSSTGSFTEFNVLRDCDFLLGCQSAIWYLQTGTGDASFHGSGIEGGTINNSGINSVLVLSPAANPYNAPFSPTIFVHANVTIISYPASAGVYRPNFYGTLKLEVQAGRALLCDAPAGTAIAYVGKVLSQSTNVVFGSFFICEGVFSALNGSRQTIGGRVSRTQALTTGANTLPAIPYNIMEGCVFLAVRVTGPNYEYRTLHCSWGSGVGGAMQLIATPGQFNNPGWGPPVVTLNGSNQIVITNAAYPVSGVIANIDILQIGQSPFSTFVP